MKTNSLLPSQTLSPSLLTRPKPLKLHKRIQETKRHCRVCEKRMPRFKSIRPKRELCRKHSFQVVMLMKCRNISLEQAIEVAKTKFKAGL